MDFLPLKFQEKMKELLGDEFNSFLDCYKEKHNAGLRANTLKIRPEDFKALCSYAKDRVSWTENGFYYDESEQPAKHPYYYAGVYYIQEPSAMLPAAMLPVRPGDKVLDLCAAPGGKSTELGAKLRGRGMLVSNDISNSRAKALLKNVELFGIRNAVVISEAPSKLENAFPGFFDKILVDAPCSGEGMFRKSHAIIKNWEQYGTEYYAKLQREILPSAVRMLKPGGYMIYSTCTFSKTEDEDTLKFILDIYPDMHVVKLIEDDDPRYTGFKHAECFDDDYPEEIKNALRLYPHRIKGEGHFTALLHKDADEADRISLETVPNTDTEDDYAAGGFKNSYDEKVRRQHKDISKEAFDFFERIGFEIAADRLIVKDDRIFMVPEGMPLLNGYRVMRSGLLLGEMKKERFEPSQALASALHPSEYDNVYNIAADNPDAVKYLKCETISLPPETADGYLLVCCDGFSLGWGKAACGRFKNKYLPGWRMM